ncbi:MAG: AmmeMemoRadiSam system radical SAM enzyme [Lachnospiraceae bacterium]|nr:AmmeMemoRadiSam system radical SAM enzyme [Lachnospiraceae bacterium]
MKCEICPHHCDIQEGKSGICHAWTLRNGALTSLNYGKVTSIALDPIEKKPLMQFYPGSRILSLGSFGCNLICPWCQNDSISRGEAESVSLSPEEIVQKAKELVPAGNIGIAFTYNEPMICPDFIVDTAKLAHREGLKNVLVTNGMITAKAHERFLPFIDAYNIDLKTAYASSYRSIGGDLDAVVHTILRASENAHVEVTTLIVPGFNDTEEEMRTIAQIVSSIDPEIVLHVTRFFPAGRMKHVPPTDVKKVYHFAEVAREYLTSVFTGNC